MLKKTTEHEDEVNIGNKSSVKDRGEARVFYEVFSSHIDLVQRQYWIYLNKPKHLLNP